MTLTELAALVLCTYFVGVAGFWSVVAVLLYLHRESIREWLLGVSRFFEDLRRT